jgi:ABC-2 type transport system ATP-binding protein
MIEVCHLTKTYGEVVAVDDLTFTVAPGAVTGFLGPNGAGKSTTLRMILGLDHPAAGTAHIAGRPYRELPRPLREVGSLLSAHHVHPRRAARDHLRAQARSNGIDLGRVDQVLDRVGLTEVAHQRVGTFSLGMTQRRGIAGALLGDPGILIFDEPLNGLDPDGIRWVRTLLRALAAEGRTVLVSSHLMAEMQLTAAHLLVIGRGRLIADQSMSEMIATRSRTAVLARVPEHAHRDRLRATPVARGAETLVDGIDLTVHGRTAAQIGDLAFELGVRLQTLRAEEVSLEDAYMEMTANAIRFGGHP